MLFVLMLFVLMLFVLMLFVLMLFVLMLFILMLPALLLFGLIHLAIESIKMTFLLPFSLMQVLYRLRYRRPSARSTKFLTFCHAMISHSTKPQKGRVKGPML